MKKCEVHHYLSLKKDGKCTCEENQKELEELREKFWNEWQKTPEEDKLSWIQTNLPYSLKNMISMEDGLHILECMDSMVASLCEKHPGGDFVEAVLSNDLMKTLDTADDINQIVLRTYMLFIYNKVPYFLRRTK